MGKTAINFRFAPDMPAGARFRWIAGLLFVGFLIQLTISVFFGWLFFLTGCLLGVIKGRSTEPETTPAVGDWKTTTIEELQDIGKLSEEIGKWREKADGFRATSTSGCLMLLLASVTLAVGAFIIAIAVDAPLRQTTGPFAPPLEGGAVLPIWVLDALSVMIPIWFAGWLTVWEPPELPRKARYLLRIYQSCKSQPELEFLPSLYVSGNGEAYIPMDCRLLVRIKDAPQDFIGIQVQVSLNEVKGTTYPYCYCVVIAKKEFGLRQKTIPLLDPPEGVGILAGLFTSDNDKKEKAFPTFDGSIAEVTSESDVDVVVVRQITAGEGYHTTESQALAVFSDALGLARTILTK